MSGLVAIEAEDGQNLFIFVRCTTAEIRFTCKLLGRLDTENLLNFSGPENALLPLTLEASLDHCFVSNIAPRSGVPPNEL
mmetsp:Transcript_20067/g.28258  ORF Transcript_20067/g.28258 Transcript_20067/m.28258 type:complete len:80 (-) Transcript_20067:279-518(-)